MPQRIPNIQSSYDRVAEEYACRISGELEHKPLDRLLLDAFAERVRASGPACDLGCGPGHVTRYLHERGVSATGIDLSPGMVDAARRRNPEIEFTQGDMLSLPTADASLAGIVAFYSLIHFSCPEFVAALLEMRRVLRPGGLVLLAFHIGDQPVHLDEWWGQPVSLDFEFFRTEEVTGMLLQAGFTVLESLERDPYPGVEHPSRRAYLLAEPRP
ncbi:MAG: methylase involved in ubiquinone/menaquinone biosynthesis [Gemmataceae bacterium]|nr:methylase involved in ubiquinone/menaquinone biosynthesis [Gemmataceae bacterium]